MRIAIFLIAIFMTTQAHAGQITLTYPDAKLTDIYNALTDEGGRCNEGETNGQCVKRIIAQQIKFIVNNYHRQKAAEAAYRGVTDIEIS